MSVIFISHSSEDRTLAQELAGRLRVQGYDALFLDFDLSDGIPAGQRWERELFAALRRSDGLIFLGTAASVMSHWCFAEVALARSLGMPIFALRATDGARLGLLGDIQWVDLADGDAAYGRLWAGMKRARLDPSESRAWNPTRSPYPGLKAFSAEDAAVFFGRNDETRRLIELVQPTLSRGSGRWVTIVGPSGSGKSSLLCAGLLANLARAPDQWVIVPTFVPGTRPTHRLAASLSRALAARGCSRPAEDLEKTLADASAGSAALAEIARDLSDSPETSSVRVLVAIDQAEEVITRAGQLEQEAFLRLLKGATGDDSPLWVVCTLRSEYLSSAPERAGLSEVTDDSMVLEPLSRNRLSEVIARPAHRAGLEFEPGLVERMVEETTGGDALPLLAHTLYELAQDAAADERTRIRATDYEQLGGVVGALQRRADQLMTELSARGRGDDVIPTLLKLVTLDQDGDPVRRRVTRSSLDAPELQIVDAFVDARLLSSGRRDGERTDAVVEVTHEALLRQWEPLRQAIAESRTSLRMRAELEREAADWEAGGREESYLLRGARVASFDEWVHRDRIQLGELDGQFLEASRALASRELNSVRRSNRRLRHLLVGVASLLLIALAAGALAVISRHEADLQRDLARTQADVALSRQLVAQARALRGTQPDVAVLLGVEALHLVAGSAALDARIALLETLNRPFHVTDHYLLHEDAVRAAAISPTDPVLASGGDGNVIKLWDLNSGRQIGEPLSGHTDWVQGLAFSRDGSLLASVSHDGTIRLWDARTGEPRGQPMDAGTGPLSGLAFHPDGSLLATSGEDGAVRLWDVTTGLQRGGPLIEEDQPLWGIAFNQVGSLLAWGDSAGLVHVWNMATGQADGAPLAGHDGWATGVAFSPDGSRLASTGMDGTVRLWDLSSRQPLVAPMTGHEGEVSDVAFDPTGSALASAGRDGTVRLWDAWSGQPRGEPLIGHSNAVRSVEFTRDGRGLASASFDHTVRVWQVATTLPGRQLLSGHGAQVTDLAVGGRDHALLASASADGTVRVWDPEAGGQHGMSLEGHAGWVTGVAFSPTDPTLLASGGADGTVRLWDLDTGQPRGEPLRGHTGEVSGVAFDPDGKRLASSGRDGTVRLWDVRNGRQLDVALAVQGEQFLDVAFSPDGHTLAAATDQGTVRLWDATTGHPRDELLADHTGWVLGLAYTPDSRLLASASGDGTIRLWDLSSGRQRGDPMGHSNEVDQVTFSGDGSVMASASKDRTVRLWDVDTGRPIGEPLTVDVGPVALEFLGGGSLLAVGGGDGSVRLMQTRAATLERDACDIANRNLTQSEWVLLVGPTHPYRRTCPMAVN
jgi:WD40 repeat protein